METVKFIKKPVTRAISDETTTSVHDEEDYYQTSSLIETKSATTLSISTMSKIMSYARSIDQIDEIEEEKKLTGNYSFTLYEWMLLLVISLNLFVMMGFLGCMGLFYVELLDEFQCSRSITSAVVSLPWGMAFGSGVLTGLLINRYPCGMVIIIGSLMMGGGIIASSFATSVVFLIITLGLLTGLGGSFIFIGSYIGTGLYFGPRGEYAIATVSLSVPLGFLVYPLLTTLLVDEFTWRGALLILGGIALNGVPFGAIIWMANPDKQKDSMEGPDNNNVQSPISTMFNSSLTLNEEDKTTKLCRDILCNKNFLSFLFAISMLMCLVTMTLNQLTDFCLELGINKSVASTFLTLFNIPSFFGRLGSSMLLRFTNIPSSGIFIICITLYGIAMTAMCLAHNFLTILIVVIITGFLQGPPTGLYTCVIIEFVGLKRSATAQGITDTTYGILTIVVGFIGGLLSEMTKSYKTGFLVFGIVTAISGIILSTCILIDQCKTTRTNGWKDQGNSSLEVPKSTLVNRC